VQKQVNLMSWEDKQTVKKGNLGEQIIREYLEKSGWIVYFPFSKGAHWFDMLATRGKERVVAIDIKTKARFNKWAAQGIDVKAYKEYVRFYENNLVPFFIIFIDDKIGDVHSADIRKLKDAPYFNPTPYIIAWELKHMKRLDLRLTAEQIRGLSAFDQRKYEFNPIN
jgi:Holliday junction resolvase